MSKEWNPDTLLDVLGSALARRILVLARREPQSADQIADRCEASLPTVYRRLDALAEYGLITEELTVNVDGNNYQTYETVTDQVRIDVLPDGIETTVGEQRDIVDQFEAFWTDLEEGGSE